MEGLQRRYVLGQSDKEQAQGAAVGGLPDLDGQQLPVLGGQSMTGSQFLTNQAGFQQHLSPSSSLLSTSSLPQITYAPVGAQSGC